MFFILIMVEIQLLFYFVLFWVREKGDGHSNLDKIKELPENFKKNYIDSFSLKNTYVFKKNKLFFDIEKADFFCFEEKRNKFIPCWKNKKNALQEISFFKKNNMLSLNFSKNIYFLFFLLVFIVLFCFSFHFIEMNVMGFDKKISFSFSLFVIVCKYIVFGFIFLLLCFYLFLFNALFGEVCIMVVNKRKPIHLKGKDIEKINKFSDFLHEELKSIYIEFFPKSELIKYKVKHVLFYFKNKKEAINLFDLEKEYENFFGKKINLKEFKKDEFLLLEMNGVFEKKSY